jgi:hypothetical protein
MLMFRKKGSGASLKALNRLLEDEVRVEEQVT